MVDMVTKGTGDSRYLKSVSDFLTRYPTYADFAAALIAGTLPVDFNGINPDGIRQRGTPLNRKNLLAGETCEMLGGDPETMVPNDAFQLIAALASMGGGGGDIGELEDTALEVGSFTNAGAGWNTYHFRETFDAAPQVLLQAEDFEGVVLIKSITAEGFLYCLRTLSTGDYYTAAGTVASSTHSANTLVNGTTTTNAEVKINYLAVEYGGER